VRTGPGTYLVHYAEVVWTCKLKGRLRNRRERLSDMVVCIGDHVLLDRIQPASPAAVAAGEAKVAGVDVAGSALISEILPRRASLSRMSPPPWPGAAPIQQVLAVNIDLVVIIIVAAVTPPMRMNTIDSYLLLARQAGIMPLCASIRWIRLG